MIGTFGKNLIFETSSQRVFTPEKMSHTAKGRWNNHTVVGAKPKKEFSGADLQGFSMSIKLRADYGVKPRQTIETIVKMVESGTAEFLIIGGRPVGSNRFVITDVSDEWDTVYRGGELFSASVSLTFEEYA
ncbi:phage tail protein [Oscillibacter ruminantium]|uniref:phage tail protein n=1 Tax=Oscillibacter ruminantium TaxID=1263547 RepID=UPI0033239557